MVEKISKQCRICKRIKPLHNFYERTPGLHRTECKDCAAIIHKKYYENNREDFISKYFDKAYGINLETYEKMLQQQNGVCKICGETEVAKCPKGKIRRLAVDHNHTTKKVRGLLCSKCNRVLGLLKDETDLLKRMINYLEENNENK